MTSLDEVTKKKFEKGLQDIKSNLERIDLSNNVLETSNTKKLGPEEAKELAKAIKKSATLRILKIKQNRIGDEGAKHILNSLMDNQTIETLFFGENRLSDSFIDTLCEFLNKNSSLKSLDIENNQITSQGIMKLCEVLLTNYSLTYLNIESNKIGDEGAVVISDLISSNQTLRTLKLAGNVIEIEGFKVLTNCLNISITDLTLDNKTIEANSHYSSLKTKIRDNCITSYVLKQKIVNWKNIVDNLKVLILQRCEITGIPGFHKFSKLVVLDLRDNNIGNIFIKNLTESLNTNLRQLMLQGNRKINDESAKLIFNCIEYNFALCHLSLKDTRVSTELQNELEERISSHRKFYRTPVHEIIIQNMDLYLYLKEIQTNKSSPNANLNFVEDKLRKLILSKSVSQLEMALFMCLVFDLTLFNYLVSNGVDINAKYKGTPILHVAAMCDAYDFIKVLFEKGVDLSIVNNEGKTCKDVAIGKCRSLFENIKQLKVIIVGKAEVGKTTLVKRIIKPEKESYNVFKRKGRTDGIEMYEWNTGLNKDNLIQLWDFGGQELFYTAHQFFISKNSITLLFFKIGDPNMKKELVFWLNSIQYIASKSKVIIVGTHFDMVNEEGREEILNSISKELESLLAVIKKQLINQLGNDNDKIEIIPCPKFKNSLLFWPVSGKTGLGVDALENLITGFSFNTVVRKDFLKLTESIIVKREEKKKNGKPPILSREEMNKLISRIFPSNEEMKANLKQLHELGFILDFGSYYIVIHPQWLSSVFRSVISLKNSSQIRDGRIEKKQIIQNLKGLYTPSVYEFLIELMEKCQICIPEPFYLSNSEIKRSSGLYKSQTDKQFSGLSKSQTDKQFSCPIMIIPSQLPPYSFEVLEQFYIDNFTFIQFFNNQVVSVEIFSREYTFYFIPAGVFEDIFSRVLIFLGQSIEYWKDGFYFTLKGQNKEETKIIFQQLEKERPTYFERYLRLSVNGKNGHTYVATFHFLIEGVLKEKYPLLWNGVSINIKYQKNEYSSTATKASILKLIREKRPILDSNQNPIDPVKLVPEEIPENFQIDPKIYENNPSNIKFIPGRKFIDNKLYSSYFCRALNAPGIYFIKFFKNDAEKMIKYEEEFKLLQGLKHPNILKFLFTSKNESNIYLVMESFDDSLESIQKILENEIPIDLPKNPLENEKVLNEYWWNIEEIIYFGLNILSGLNYLHKKGIIYGDIRERNIGARLDKKSSKPNRPKIESLFLIDFSAAQKSNEENKTSDIHSFGVLLCELVANNSFYANNLDRLKMKMENHPLKNIIEECLQPESTKRPNTSQLLKKFEQLAEELKKKSRDS